MCRIHPPKFSLSPGRGLCPSLLGDALPRARLVARAGGAVIDRLNYRLISYLRPRALIGCSLTSSNPAAPRWARRGAAAGGGALLTSPKVISNLKWTLFQLLGASLPLFMVGGKLPPRRRF